jgi:transglutaminase-like putative cysteine protease
MNPEMLQYVQPTPIIDSDSRDVAQFAYANSGDCEDHKVQAIRLYYAIRDGIRYDPYTFLLSAASMRASTTLKAGRGWCVTKAILLAACCRVKGIPARLGFADVRNHLTTARMREAMKTDVFFWHGYTSIFLDGTWVKATPAFNVELCDKFRIRPLEFDGRNDSIYHPFDLDGNRHMEYLRYRGEFADVPMDQMIESLIREYPELKDLSDLGGDFDRDVDLETSKG